MEQAKIDLGLVFEVESSLLPDRDVARSTSLALEDQSEDSGFDEELDVSLDLAFLGAPTIVSTNSTTPFN